MAQIMDMFKVLVLVQLFYSFAITGLIYAMPADSLQQVESFSDITGSMSLQNVGEQVQGSLEKQTNLPVIEFGALLFYSSNILLDLLLNFAFAVPQMIGLLINGLTRLLSVNIEIWQIVQLFSSVVIMVLYFISLMQLVSGVRSGRIV